MFVVLCCIVLCLFCIVVCGVVWCSVALCLPCVAMLPLLFGFVLCGGGCLVLLQFVLNGVVFDGMVRSFVVLDCIALCLFGVVVCGVV